MEEELWEEEFIERCVLELLEEEEQWEWFVPSRDLPAQRVAELQDQISVLVLDPGAHADTRLDLVVSARPPTSCCLGRFVPLISFSSADQQQAEPQR